MIDLILHAYTAHANNPPVLSKMALAIDVLCQGDDANKGERERKKKRERETEKKKRKRERRRERVKEKERERERERAEDR